MKTQKNIHDVLATLSYVKKFSKASILIKIGGAALEDDKLVTAICEDLALIRSVGISIVVVHGGGPAINRELEAKGIQWNFIDGQRVTTPAMMDVIETTLVGSVNRKIVRALNGTGATSVGFSGADAMTLLCKPSSAKLGQVGEIVDVNSEWIRTVLAQAIPVIAPVGTGPSGEAYNVNADWAASRIAQAMGINKVLFLTDQEGILDSSKNLIPALDAGELENLIETNVVQGGMLAKSRTILHALRNGVTDVHVLHARRPHGLIEELFTNEGVGTHCRVRSRNV